MNKQVVRIIMVIITLALSSCGGGGGGGSAAAPVPTTPPGPTPTPITPVPQNVKVISFGDKELAIEWFAEMNNSYSVYYAAETFASLNGDISNYATLSESGIVMNATSPLTVAGLDNDRLYFLVIVARKADVDSDISQEVVGTPRAPRNTATLGLNDTGISFSGVVDAPFGNDATCVANATLVQDCQVGRGTSGADFSFTKLAQDGSELAASASDWQCVRDNVTQLVWQVKTDTGLANKTDTYNWFNQNTLENGGNLGTENDDGAICENYDASQRSSFCNTQFYQVRVNQTALCGASNWRIPELEELQNLIDYGVSDTTKAMIDATYFPNTQTAPYWTYTPDVLFPDAAVVLDFQLGNFNSFRKNSNYHIRLVSTGAN